MTVTVDLEASPPQVAIADEAGVTHYRGPLPPFGAALPSKGEELPGVDYDIEWTLHHPQLGSIEWALHVRDGIEVARPDEAARRRAQLSVPYAWLLAVFYGGASWAEFLDGERAMPAFDALSCLAGVIYPPGAARRGSIPAAALDALIAWSSPAS